MNLKIKNTLLATVIFGAYAFSATSVTAQEVALVHASNVMATNSLSDINTTLTPKRLAKEFSKELTADLDVRLPQEQSELFEALRIKSDFATSIRAELNVRLINEIRSLVVANR